MNYPGFVYDFYELLIVKIIVKDSVSGVGAVKYMKNVTARAVA